MPVYTIKTLSEEGLLESSVITAPTRKSLEKTLEKDGKIITGIKEKKEPRTAKPVSG